MRRPSIWALALTLALTFGVAHPGQAHSQQARKPQLTPISTYRTGIFNGSAAEIPAYDPGSFRLYVTNSHDNVLDVLDLEDPTAPTKIESLRLRRYGARPTSVDVCNGLVGVSVVADPITDDGVVVFFDRAGEFVDKATVGAAPKMVVFTPDCAWLLVANEGVPNEDYSIDPEGTVSFVEVATLGGAARRPTVLTADFKAFNDKKLRNVRIFGPGATVAQDLEPEYIAMSGDNKRLYISLQENNAIAIIDCDTHLVTDVIGLGLKVHNRKVNALDASDRDNAINMRRWKTWGMYQPDALASFNFGKRHFILSANEGEARDYTGFSEEARVEDLVLAKNYRASTQDEDQLGRLKTTTIEGDTDGDGAVDKIHSFGARSISVWNAKKVKLQWDSGRQLEDVTAAALPDDFNADRSDNASFDTRSDDKGPEPESVVVGLVGEKRYAFIALEQIGGIVVYQIRGPKRLRFLQYINTRDFSGDPTTDTAGDLGPGGMDFVTAANSPTGIAMLIVSYEVSGSTTVFNFQ